MKRAMIYSVILITAAGGTAFSLLKGRGEVSPPAASASAPPPVEVVAAPGRVEPISEEVKVAAEIGGKLKSVPVEEGDRVRRGQVVAELVNDDYRARVASARARVLQQEAELRRVINGARQQERREAWQGVTEAEAMLENARAEIERRQSLYRKGVIAREESDRAEREYKVALARREAAAQRHALLDDEAREEDRSRAEADLALARAELDEARALLDKTFIRSPLDGVVLRKHLKAGESVSEMRDSTIVTLADTAVLRVRVDVDEADVGRLQLGQAARLKADAFPGREFRGRVVEIGQVLGKKNLRTDEPTERVDTKILETLVELENGQKLPPGLRVDAFIEVAAGRQ